MKMEIRQRLALAEAKAVERERNRELAAMTYRKRAPIHLQRSSESRDRVRTLMGLVAKVPMVLEKRSSGVSTLDPRMFQEAR